MRKTKSIARKPTHSDNSLIPESGITGTKLNQGDKMLLYNQTIVSVIEQRPLRNFTTVSDGVKLFEVQTDKLTKINE